MAMINTVQVDLSQIRNEIALLKTEMEQLRQTASSTRQAISGGGSGGGISAGGGARAGGRAPNLPPVVAQKDVFYGPGGDPNYGKKDLTFRKEISILASINASLSIVGRMADPNNKAMQAFTTGSSDVLQGVMMGHMIKVNQAFNKPGQFQWGTLLSGLQLFGFVTNVVGDIARWVKEANDVAPDRKYHIYTNMKKDDKTGEVSFID